MSHSRLQTAHVRLAEADDAASLFRLHKVSWQFAYRGILPGHVLDQMISRRQENWWRNTIATNHSILLLFFAHSLVGYVHFGPNRAPALAYAAEIYEIYLEPHFTRLGFGSHLFKISQRSIVQHGFKSCILWTLKENLPAVSFFKTVHGSILANSYEKFGDKNFEKLAFGWESL